MKRREFHRLGWYRVFGPTLLVMPSLLGDEQGLGVFKPGELVEVTGSCYLVYRGGDEPINCEPTEAQQLEATQNALAMSHHLLSLRHLSAEERYQEIIRHLASKFGIKAGGGYVVPFTQGDLACLVGLRRESLSKLLPPLRKEGLVATGYSTVTWLQPLEEV